MGKKSFHRKTFSSRTLMILKYGKLMKFQWKIYISIYFIMSKMNGFIVQVYFLIWKLKLFPCWRQTLLIHLVSIKKDNMRSKLFSSEVIYDLIHLLGFFWLDGLEHIYVKWIWEYSHERAINAFELRTRARKIMTNDWRKICCLFGEN